MNKYGKWSLASGHINTQLLTASARQCIAEGGFELVPPDELKNDAATLEYLQKCKKIIQEAAILERENDNSRKP